MLSCDTCPGGEACAGDRLTPVLLRVFELYAGGMTDTLTLADALTAQTNSITLAADGTDYMVVPLVGEFMRIKVVSTRSNADASTTTVRAVFKQ